MSAPARRAHSDYMQFAKLRTAARYNLASSGVANCAMEDISCSPTEFALHGDNAYGYAPLTERIAARFGVDPACVVTANGCSFANYLAFATLLVPGDEVLVEEPTYELLTSTLQFLRVRITRFVRAPESRYGLDADAIAAAVTPHTRLIMLTNLHNPSSALANDEMIAAIAEVAGRQGAYLLVDEVYRELLFRDGEARTSFRPDGNILVTSSLTKAYGLSGLRCGWCLAPPEIATRMRQLNDLHGVLPPHVVECMSVAAFDRLADVRARANEMIDANRAAYLNLLGNHPKLEQTLFPQGTTMFPRLRVSDGDALFDLLIARFETSLVPGRFFGRPTHVRIGLGADPAMTMEALGRVRAALDFL